MHPGAIARTAPDKPAIVFAETGEVMTYAQLDRDSAKLANYWLEKGLVPGNHVAVLTENCLEYYVYFWAAMRSGLYFTAISTHLSASEAGYILNDCGAVSFIVSEKMTETGRNTLKHAPNCMVNLVQRGLHDDFWSLEREIEPVSAERPEREPRGSIMFYTSGTTGHPKGVKFPQSDRSVGEWFPELQFILDLFQFQQDTVYLNPAPLYHSAPTNISTLVHAVGGTIVTLDRFDAEMALKSIDLYKATHSQWVPTMFSRMLDLEPDIRQQYNLSSHKVAFHAAAPIAPALKHRMIEWWGPIIHEYYGGTEACGVAYTNSEDWLKHPGTVGRAVVGTLRICDDNGDVLPAGQVGDIFFENPGHYFDYYGAPEKTAKSRHPRHSDWFTLGDIGYVDGEGFLFLTDRKSFTIISGGVNIYPQEIENALLLHPAVKDVAVFGVPNAEFGEEVKAVVEPDKGYEPTSRLAQELIAYARQHLAKFKAPKSLDFVDVMPRLPTGKLDKKQMRAPYWGTENAS